MALAALAGVLLAPIYSVFPTMGRDFVLLAFCVVIVGGMGSIIGAVCAGLLLAQLQSLASLVIAPVWTEPIVFALMVVFLVVRPQGLFGRLGHAWRPDRKGAARQPRLHGGALRRRVAVRRRRAGHWRHVLLTSGNGGTELRRPVASSKQVGSMASRQG